MNKMFRSLLILLLTALLLSSCNVQKSMEEKILLDPVTQPHGTVTVMRGDYTPVVVKDAFVVPKIVSISLDKAGTVEEIPFVSGEKVRKGDVILRLDCSAAEREIDEILKEQEYQHILDDYDDRLYELQKQIYDRQKQQYYRQGAGWQATELVNLDLQELELSREETLFEREKREKDWENRLTELQKTVDESVLYAPASGYIYYSGTADNDGQAVVVREGENVPAYAELAYITDSSELHIETEERINLSLLQLPYYALVSGEAIPITHIPQSSDEIAHDNLLKRIPKSVFSINKKTSGLEAGMYAPIVFEQKQYEDVLLVPANAVIRDIDLRQDFVYVVRADGTHARRDVEIESDGVMAVILSGLSEGEVLYVSE